ncbi:biotin-dependent carboxyltransferase family protein [Bordetella sp. 15P40C-2]|uniref:5-oxoprolinase subunit C family protein n=1 Tax=Bordetella sp. 15P40C-2 TaxID=2572246 RepID=UPI00132B219E|nr:biotin-dependent carboxyltransferase family protein [Bordetella sp. 15P40C-2]MVW72335.1 5-oxoprolinase/urea amidolyase family protein [Bordetella sp. 15P40C-2]
MIEVDQPGFQSSVQDLGRYSWRHLGVGQSGAMDPFALSIANILLGNDVNAAALEITMGAASVTFQSDTEIALTGARVDATLDGSRVPNWWALSVRAGQQLRLGATHQGVRSYIAVRGGIAVPSVLDSASTDLKGEFGGLLGRALKKGDVLPLHPTPPLSRRNPGFGLPMRPNVPYAYYSDGREPEPPGEDSVPVIHVLPAAQWTDLTDVAQQQFLDATWIVSAQSNRVGCRLEGPVLQTRMRREMRSHGIVPGVVQLPPSGQPIVQLCDGNTSGGYPVLGVVIRADLPVFAQLPPNACLRFALCDMEYAATQWSRYPQLLDDLALRCELTRQRFN